MKKKVNISLNEEIAQQLRELAKKSNRNVSQWVTDKVMEASKEFEKSGRLQDKKELHG